MYIIINTTNNLHKTNRYYNKDISFYDRTKINSLIILKPGERYIYNNRYIDKSITRLKDLNYIRIIDQKIFNNNNNLTTEILNNKEPKKVKPIVKIDDNPNNNRLPVIMCVWKRLDGFDKIIKQLNKQTFKNFKLFIWNNNLELIENFELLLKKAQFQYEILHSEKNVGGFGRFYYANKITKRTGFIDYCVFIDDDQSFGNETLQTFYDEREPKTIKSQWGWKFNGLNYYTNRIEVKPTEKIHYAGTGGMIADIRVFEDDKLFNCKEEYWFVEDLWLSYFANKIHNYKLYKSKAIIKNGDDEHSLYKVVKNIKTPMLNYLINDLDWGILKKDEITIIIPTYNNVEYIDDCINSIRDNITNNLDIEIIIGIDNCEKTKNHVNNNKDKYNDIKFYYFNKNVGPYTIKNTLARYAKNDSIIFFDSDDIFFPNSINKIVDRLKENNYVVFRYDEFTTTYMINNKVIKFGEGVIGISKKTFLKLNGYQPWRCAADTEFRERYSSKYNNNINRLNDVIFNRRVHETSLTKDKTTGIGSDIRTEYRAKISENKNNNYPNPIKLYIEENHYII